MAWKRTLKDGTVRWEDKVYFKTPTGYRTQTVWAPTRAEVVRQKSKLLELRDKKPTNRSAKPSTTVGELGEMFTVRHVSIKERATRDYYLTALRYRIAPYLYEKKLRTLHRSDVDEWIAELHSVTTTDKHGNTVAVHSPRNINAALSTLKIMLAKGVEWGFIESNAATGVAKLRERKHEIRVYPPDEVETLCQAAHELAIEQAPRGAGHAELARIWSTRDQAMLMTAAFTGVRLGELLALRWEDLADGWLRVEHSIDNRTGTVKQTKTFQGRSVPVLEPTARALEWWGQVTPYGRRGLMFPSRRAGSPLRQNTWRQRSFKPVAERAGLPDARPHELRHTFASLMIARGVTPLRLSKWMGHSDPMTTMRVYAHLFDRVEDDIITRVNASLFMNAAE